MNHIQELYEKVIVESNYQTQIDAEVETAVRDSLERLTARHNLPYEEIRDELYGIANAAEKAGFAAGFRYGTTLLLESLIVKEWE